MKFWKKNDGLTLVELMISIAIGTMIFAAATTVLLLGIRINHHTTDSIMQQYTARTVITMMEQMAEEGSVNKTYRASDGSWKLGTKIPNDDRQAEDDFEKVILSYDSKNQTIYTGDLETPILENVVASYIIMEGNVLTVSLEDTEGTYSSSVCCRIEGMTGGENFTFSDHDDSISGSTGTRNDSESRELFLLILNSQVGTRGGFIDHSKEPGNQEENAAGDPIITCSCENKKFFSEWFLPNGYDQDAISKGWGPDTPWCACFVSWGLVSAGVIDAQHPKWFENVDKFMKHFKTKANQDFWKDANAIPVPGDLIFFDMVGGTTDNPSHMGVVLSVDEEKGTITTIEGNSADMVAIREYVIAGENKDNRILGYGDPWAAQAN